MVQPTAPGQALVTSPTGAPLPVIARPAPVAPVVDAGKPLQTDAILLTVGGVAIEELHAALGTNAALVSHWKTTLYARMIAHYPELVHLPVERFAELVQFDVQARWDERKTMTLALYLRGSDIGYPSRNIVDTSCVVIDMIQCGNSIFLVAQRPPRKSADYADGMGGQRVTPYVATLISFERRRHVIARVIDTADFQHTLAPGMIATILAQRFPELAVHFHLDRLLHLALQNPEALTGYLRAEILQAEQAMRALLQQREIELRAADAAVAERHAEAQRVEAALQRLRTAHTETEGAMTATVTGLQQRCAHLTDEITRWERARAGLRRLLAEEVVVPVGVIFSIDTALAGRDNFQTGDPRNNEQLFQTLHTNVRTGLEQLVSDMIRVEREAWAGYQVRIDIACTLLQHRRDVVKKGGFLRRQATTVDLCDLLVIATVASPSYRRQCIATIQVALRDGAFANGLAERCTGLLTDIEAAVRDVHERHQESPRRDPLTRWLTQQSAAGNPDHTDTSLLFAVEHLLAGTADGAPRANPTPTPEDPPQD